jgi:hypothetical protein
LKSLTFTWSEQNALAGNYAGAYKTLNSLDFIFYLLHISNLKLEFSLGLRMNGDTVASAILEDPVLPSAIVDCKGLPRC